MPSDLTTTEPARTFGARVRDWLPARVDARVRVAAWISFITEVMIIGTGGAVRLTGSGLGCEWPLCAPDSLVPLPGMGLHSYIEFGNRLMTGVVGLAALAVLVFVWRMRRTRRDLFTLAWIVVGGILVQAVMGGITVLADLNAGVVSFHFVASLALVSVATVFLVRMYQPAGARVAAVPRWHTALVHLTAAMMALTLVVGIVTTASGPHSGDADVVRHMLNPELMAHIHSLPGYALLALSVGVLLHAAILRLPTLRWSIAVLAILLVQIPVGVYQSRANLPALAVGVHMVLAGLAAAAMTVLVLRLRTPVAAAADAAAAASVADTSRA